MSILNLLIVICSFLITFISFYLFYHFKKQNKIPLKEQKRRTGSLLQRLASIVISFTLLINFCFYENFTKPLTVSNAYTLFMLFLLAIQVFGVMIRRQFDLKMR